MNNNLNSRTCLITGVTGQSGSYLADMLVDRGYFVVGLKRRTSLINTERVDHLYDHPDFVLEYGNLSDPHSLWRVLTKYKPAYIFNAGAQSHVRVSFDLPEETFDVVANGTLRLLNVMKEVLPESRLVQFSSSEMFGDVGEVPQNENTRMNPASPYACFPGDVKIVAKQNQKSRTGKNRKTTGLKAIKDINIGDLVLSFNEKTSDKEWKPVTNTFKRKTNTLLQVKCSNNNRLSCTPEHPFFVPDKGWIEAQKLEVGDKIIQYKYPGLNFRCNKGRKLKDLYGEDVAEYMHRCRSEGLKNAWKDPNNTKLENFHYNPGIDIVYIEEINKEEFDSPIDVYNFEVEGNNNYFAYGLLVHNCAKLASYNLCRNYRASYDMFISNAILFNTESPRRGETFVTKKISNAIARIKLGKQDYVELGNLDALRDWSYCPDSMDAVLNMIINHHKPDDFVVASGEQHSVQEYLEETCKVAGMTDKDPQSFVKLSERLLRPQEVPTLLGDYSKAHKELQWAPRTSFDELVKLMYEHEYEKEKQKKD